MSKFVKDRTRAKGNLNFTRNPHRFLLGLLVASSLLIAGCFLSSLWTRGEQIKTGKAFEPQRDTTIAGGEYTIPSMDIPEDVTVVVEDNVHLVIEGDANLNGDIAVNCADITFDVEGAFILEGNLQNPCENVEHESDITFNLAGDQPITLGSEDSIIETAGDIIINIGEVQDLPLTQPLPFEASEEPQPPVCSLTPDSLVTDLMEDGNAYVILWGECLDPDGGSIQKMNLAYTLYGMAEPVEAPENAAELLIEGETILTLTDPGMYSITLSGEDDEGEQSTVAAVTLYVSDPNLEEEKKFVSLAFDQSEMTYEQGSLYEPELWLESMPDDVEPYAYQWLFLEDEENAFSISEDSYPEINLEDPGVYNIAVLVFLTPDIVGSASTSFYVYPQISNTTGLDGLAKPEAITVYDCDNPPDNVIKADADFEGKNVIARVLPDVSRPIMIMPGVTLTAYDGKPFENARSDEGFVYGEKGRNGGRIHIENWNGDVVVCGSVTMIAGSGGDGQDAISVSENGRYATAIGGSGGKPGTITLVNDLFHEIVMEGNGVGNKVITMQIGVGGDGGDATATGGNGTTDCNNPTKGGKAIARAGRGGSSKYTASFSLTRFSGGSSIDITLPAGATTAGGNGGTATATGGTGGSAANPPGGAACDSCIAGAKGGEAIAKGGPGGSVYMKVKGNAPIFTPILTAGDGGVANPKGGAGGNASNCLQAANGPTGGTGGKATAIAGKPGKATAPNIGGEAGSVSGEGGKGGAGGRGLVAGGAGGAGGLGIGGNNVKNGAAGAPGGIMGLKAVIKFIELTLINPVTQVIRMAINFDVPNWDWGEDDPIDQIEVQFMNEILIIDFLDADQIDDFNFEIELNYEKALESGLASVTLIDKYGNRSDPEEVEVLVPEEELPTAAGSPPVITAVEYPDGNVMDPIANDRISLPADGTEVSGWIHFYDEDGDLLFARFTPMETDSNFDGFEFTIDPDYLEGDIFEGRFQFYLFCGMDQAGEQVTLRVELMDEAINWSEPAMLAIECE